MLQLFEDCCPALRVPMLWVAESLVLRPEGRVTLTRVFETESPLAETVAVRVVESPTVIVSTE